MGKAKKYTRKEVDREVKLAMQAVKDTMDAHDHYFYTQWLTRYKEDQKLQPKNKFIKGIIFGIKHVKTNKKNGRTL